MRFEPRLTRVVPVLGDVAGVLSVVLSAMGRSYGGGPIRPYSVGVPRASA